MTTKDTMPAGVYYIGDLCYVMSAEWDEVCDKTIPKGDVLNGKFTLDDGRTFTMYSTMYGDGGYLANNGYTVDVDAGVIGCIAVKDITDKDARMELGMIVEFDKPFKCGCTPRGLISFGGIKIKTNF